MNNTFKMLSIVTLFAALSCHGMMQLGQSSIPSFKFALTVINETQNTAIVTAFYKGDKVVPVGKVDVKQATNNTFKIDQKGLIKVTIIAGSTMETVTDFNDKTITLKKTVGTQK